MNWFADLLSQPGYLQTVIIISTACAVGLALGQIKFRGVALGVTLVFFAGIILGDLTFRAGIGVNGNMVAFAQNFGLILFVYSLGVQVGPGFFSSLKKGGIRLNILALLGMALTTITALVVGGFCGLDIPGSMGVLCGAVTNTPMLGAAQQTLLDIHPDLTETANGMASACAVGYAFGVLGVMVSLMLINGVFRKRDCSGVADASGDTNVAEFFVTNPEVFGKTVGEVVKLYGLKIIISRLRRGGRVTIPHSDTVLENGDHLLVVSQKTDVERIRSTIGSKDPSNLNGEDVDWDNFDGSHLVSKHITVTKKELNGVKLGTLHLRNQFNINITRVNRAGIRLLASPSMRLQIGDRLTVVGEADSIKKVGEILGNEEKVLNNPNLVAIFIGLIVGVVLGAVPIRIPGMSVPVKLGIAGGPIVVGILMGAFGPRLHLTTYTTRSANLMLRQMGIVTYLACLGFSAGGSFFASAFTREGLVWVAVSFLTATLPVILTGIVALKFCKINYEGSCGMLCAMMANPMALTYANSTTDGDEPSEAYATVYPLSMFIRVISAQLLMLALL